MSENLNLQRPFEILLVEDNEGDVWLTKRAFQKLSVPVEFHVAGDGVEALKFLRREAPHTTAQGPDLILLDLNMPRMDGRQLLAELKRDEDLKIIPVIILSTSAAGQDVRDSYRAYASAYLTKPMQIQEFVHRTQCLVDFWLKDVAVLPSKSEV